MAKYALLAIAVVFGAAIVFFAVSAALGVVGQAFYAAGRWTAVPFRALRLWWRNRAVKAEHARIESYRLQNPVLVVAETQPALANDHRSPSASDREKYRREHPALMLGEPDLSAAQDLAASLDRFIAAAMKHRPSFNRIPTEPSFRNVKYSRTLLARTYEMEAGPPVAWEMTPEELQIPTGRSIEQAYADAEACLEFPFPRPVVTFDPLSPPIRPLVEVPNWDVRVVRLDDGSPIDFSSAEMRRMYYVEYNRLFDQSKEIFGELERFKNDFAIALPPTGKAALDQFCAARAPLFRSPVNNQDDRFERIKATLTSLAAINSQVGYLLRGARANILRRTERAFVHLQRMIVADSSARALWNTAFGAGEVACERLGAVHLLSHGIWAFKANAAGAKTDLVLGEPISDFTEIERAAEGLVLTEWKLAASETEVDGKFQDAKQQASRYAQGALAGFELVGCRFLVVVTQRLVDARHDIDENGTIYRRVSIAVDPQFPSRP
jgi:hypothetical protein